MATVEPHPDHNPRGRREDYAPRSGGDAEPILVARPDAPDFEAFIEGARKIWNSRWFTNHGPFANQFEEDVRAALDVAHLRVVSSGTMALLFALRALGVGRSREDEVIVPGFTFVGTYHAVTWMGARAICCDVEAGGWNLDPALVEAAISPNTRAILPVHLFGLPCRVEALEAVAARHGVPVLYDAAHAMGCRLHGRSLASWGNFSALSFHATKTLHSIEGGAVVCPNQEAADTISRLRDFGFDEADRVVLPGINGKLNELCALVGGLNLREFSRSIRRRRAVYEAYREALADVKGLRFPELTDDFEWNYGYVPIRIDPATFPVSRDALLTHLRQEGIHPRSYFQPPGCDLPWLEADPDAFPHARRAANETLCLPISSELTTTSIERIALAIRSATS